jgi:hypothetical protein
MAYSAVETKKAVSWPMKWMTGRATAAQHAGALLHELINATALSAARRHQIGQQGLIGGISVARKQPLRMASSRICQAVTCPERTSKARMTL